MLNKVLITGTGCYAPPDVITNQELVDSFNAYVRKFNEQHAAEIANGQCEALKESSSEFIFKASGIKQRHVVDKKNILDINVMQPLLPERPNDTVSLQAEMAIKAAEIALKKANKKASDVDIVLLSCSNFQRPYPAVSIEVQAALGIQGYAYDMNVACSSATFGIQAGYNALKAGTGKAALIINPEICSAHLNFRDRDSHFIFGDACTATVLETPKTCSIEHPFEILSTKLLTIFSNNIRNNFGFLNRTWPETAHNDDKLFKQNGRQVFKEVIPMASKFILEHLKENNLTADQLRRLWLHQANLSMNQLIAHKILGRDATLDEAPTILDRYANTACAGSIICFDHYQDDFTSGDLGLISSFGAGYSIGSIIVKKI